MSARCAQWLNLVKPTAFYGTPTYALHLAQVAADEGLDPRDFKLSTMFFSGEPGASIPGVRNKIEELYGARVIDCGSMAEMTPWMSIAGTAETAGHAVLAGHRLHRGVRPADHAARPLRRARHAGLYPPRADVAADDPPGLGRPLGLDERERIPAAAPIRGCRWEFSAGSTTCSPSAARTSIRARSTRL